jgi:hypothetical protein
MLGNGVGDVKFDTILDMFSDEVSGGQDRVGSFHWQFSIFNDYRK